MKRMKRILGLLLYHMIGKHLPKSYARVNLGSKGIRLFCGKLILDECGKGVNIDKGASFPTNMTIGNYSGVGSNSNIWGETHIGDYVMMGSDCQIYTRNHCFDRIDIPMCKQGFQKERPVYIGDDVWIGGQVTILPGVKIGNHCIIGTSSVVTKNIPDYAIAAGNPAKVIRFRNSLETESSGDNKDE